ncbi:MAG: hypothetical protein IJU23_10960 [Proteobacteria bacterium]|nr:hypothetical protein [Pseudomonadota bacterium]
MNITQTRQVLSYIWSTHPSAPKYTGEDKVRTVAAYFRVLYQYSVEDVMEAVDRICRESPTFIPSAYEIEKRCTKHINVEAYLPREYEVLGDRLEDAEEKRLALKDDYQAAFCARTEIMREYGSKEFLDEAKQAARREEYREKCAPHEAVIEQYSEISDECGRLKARRDELLSRATWAAQDAYDKQQTQLAHKDLCSLGYDRLALEG